jgi:hypothetical protein
MNTKPDDQTLMLWMDDELGAADQAAMDSWLRENPQWIENRQSLRDWRSTMQSVFAAEVEPPYVDFFHAKLQRSLEQQSKEITAPTNEASVPFWRRFAMPLAAAASIAIAFLAGRSMVHVPHPAENIVTYTPEEGVNAEYFVASPSEGTVIVLNGVTDIPDQFSIPDTAAIDQNREPTKESASIIAP